MKTRMTKKSIEFLRVMYLRGPNIWTYRPVIEAWLDIGELEDSPSNTLPGFCERLTTWLPTLVEHRCGVGEPGGFVQRLREGTWPAHIMEHVAIELQNLAGLQAGFGKARQTSKRGIYKLAVRARNEQVGHAAIVAARDVVMAAIEDRPYDVSATVAQLREMVDSHHLGPSTACIVDAAAQRRIPWIRLNEGNLVQLGYAGRQRRIWTAETDQTSAIAEGIASDKDLTRRLLQACGVPVPNGMVVKSPDEAWEAAQEVGLPAVVKPVDANHGRGVSLELNTREEVVAAYEVADREGSAVVVERLIRGNEHRLLVVGNRVVAAARGESAWVRGDGRSTIAELVDLQLNTDPRRGLTEDFPLNRILMDQDPAIVLELARQGFQPDSIPAADQSVLIQRNGNVAFDCTDEVHPALAGAAALAARIVGLNIAGVDLVAQDISRPLEEQDGAIVEVNAGPGLLMHLKPAAGKPRPVGEAIVDCLFPNGDQGRIPIVGIAGTRGTTLIAQIVASLLELAGRHVGLACGDGLYLGRRQLQQGDCTGWKAGRRLLINRSLDAAVFESGLEAILTEGLAYDRCQVGVVTDASTVEALGEYYIHEPEQVFSVLRTQVDVVLSEGVAVLNAGDPLVVRMAALCDGEVIFYDTQHASAVLAEHRARDGRAVFLRDGEIIAATADEEMRVAEISTLPILMDDASAAHVGSILAVVAAAWALGISHDLIRAGIETFELPPHQVPAAPAHRGETQPVAPYSQGIHMPAQI